MDLCDQCGFVYDEAAVADIPPRLRAAEAAYRAVLDGRPGPPAGPDDRDTLLRRRPDPGTWSALEYTCHVRDVLLVQRDRAILALVETNPGFARMHRDERVGLARYDAHPPAQVAAQLGVAAELCATVFEGLTLEQWDRPLIYNYPAPAPRDLAWLARNTLHEVDHHLGDIRAVIARVTPAGPAPGQ
jgi:S-DNA-T family DNA segregation ATPase FtsK/SpoIIIE